jgi:hypothetical protein
MIALVAASDVAQLLADQIESLVLDLLPCGYREGNEWRCGSIAGELGHSLGVHLRGDKRGVWADFNNLEHSGDPLDLVRCVLGLTTGQALNWARQWLGIDHGVADLPWRQPSKTTNPDDPKRWQKPWRQARPIYRTLAATYFSARGLSFSDPDSRVLRFHPERCRKNLSDQLEVHPALLAALCDVRTGEQCGIINIFLQPDGRDRIRDRKGKTVTGRALGAAVMLSPFDAPTIGLAICEGVETGIKVLIDGLAPLWALGGAGNLGTFPVLGGIDCLTICADTDQAGQDNAARTATRWRQAGRQTLIATPPADDWAAGGSPR